MTHWIAHALATPSSVEIGQEMHSWVRDLFPMCRSLTGPGVAATFAYLSELMPALKLHEVASGTTAFDWQVPDEWSVRQAYVENARGERVIDFAKHNLHLVGYSEPVDTWLSREALEAHLHSLPELPDAIPYVTSYYKRTWGFCVSHNQRKQLARGDYHVVVDSTLAPGKLVYGELLLPGESSAEVLLSTYICHPSMANNELSGPAVTTALVRWLSMLPGRRLSFRVLFLPETIGAIVYLSRCLTQLKRDVVAGFVVTCVGDDRCYSFMPSRLGGTLADRVALHALRHAGAMPLRQYSYLERGSDERQYGSPGVDLPVVSVMRSKYGAYPEYHTSLDDLSLVTPTGLAGGFDVLRRCLALLEVNLKYRTRVLCEPQLGRRGLYPTTSDRASGATVRTMMNVLAYADGAHDILAIADMIGVDAFELVPIAEQLLREEVLEAVE